MDDIVIAKARRVDVGKDAALDRLVDVTGAFERVEGGIAVIAAPGVQALQAEGVVERRTGARIGAERAVIAAAGARASQVILRIADRAVGVVIVDIDGGAEGGDNRVVLVESVGIVERLLRRDAVAFS